MKFGEVLCPKPPDIPGGRNNSLFPCRIFFLPAAAERGNPHALPRRKGKGSKSVIGAANSSVRRQKPEENIKPPTPLWGIQLNLPSEAGSGLTSPLCCIPAYPLHGSGNYAIHMLD